MNFKEGRFNTGGVTSYIDVYTDVPLEWVYFFACELYDWVINYLHKYINEIYQWVVIMRQSLYEWVVFLQNHNILLSASADSLMVCHDFMIR